MCGAPTMKLTSFEADIRTLFTDRDVHAMSKAFNLASYDDVIIRSTRRRSTIAFAESVAP